MDLCSSCRSSSTKFDWSWSTHCQVESGDWVSDTEPEDDRDQGVYAISVAAGLVGTQATNLRAYERAGLLTPARSDGGTRLYSPNDIFRLRRIVELVRAGVNVAGIAVVLDIQDAHRPLRDSRRADPAVGPAR